MPSRFKRLTLAQFEELVAQFDWTRQINAVHMHHTWKPARADFQEEATIEAMWRFHTQTNHWSDIAQHITIDPKGMIWTGRNWNMPPASAKGHNGNEAAGPFMFEMIGNFDADHDTFDGEQRKTVIGVIAIVQEHFGLASSTLMFHNQMSAKTCPGSAIDRDEVIRAVEEARASPGAGSRSVNDPFPAHAIEPDADVEHALKLLRHAPSTLADDDNAEHDDHGHASRDGDRSRDTFRDLTPDDLQAMRPHVVNLTMGRFSNDGEWTTSASDVDAIFDGHLEQALRERNATDEPLRIVVFAHGGLVDEKAGLQIAHKALQWWKDNHVYPLYFVWETGAFESIGQLLRRARDEAGVSRDLADYTTDPVIEQFVRTFRGPQIWGAMKLSALQASEASITRNAADGGGGHYVAKRLADFCRQHADKVEVHAVGHSAGAIFHSYFIPAALDLGVPQFKTVAFLAPAARMDLFTSTLLPKVGQARGIDSLSIFTMSKDLEKADNCAFVYRKSLLYLIHHALEAERRAPILGLEESLRGEPQLARYLKMPAPREFNIVWSKTAGDSGRSASASYSHGGFDDDAPTMNSVLRRVLNKSDADAITAYERIVPASREAQVWGEDESRYTYPASVDATSSRYVPAPSPRFDPRARGAGGGNAVGGSPGAGRRRALCVGINGYPTAPLGGCVADARAWRDALVRLGFEAPALLLDQQATRAQIVSALASLIEGSRAGDVIVFQYSGHGTQLPDLNGDETGPDGKDEAICPYDFAEGAFLIDDDIGELCDRLPAGVNLTLFTDCCHSGTISRFAGAGPNGGVISGPGGARARFVVPDASLIAAHARFRRSTSSFRARAIRAAQVEARRELLFAACLAEEVAWESNGHGALTDRAMRVLAGPGASGLTNAGFAQQMIDAFGPNANQHPRLYALADAEDNLLLHPLGGTPLKPARPTRPHAPAHGNGHANGRINGYVSATSNGNGHIDGNGFDHGYDGHENEGEMVGGDAYVNRAIVALQTAIDELRRGRA
ncbi:caspase family protein [Caballeronia sp. LZ065]|uniref:caspase family protein n=1 Tax=Caballeronia sp. LZ065 TaxID=3038571 RepID=UPI002863E6BD|nr:caspase family protein [Caballeronia sp. LZ065]MDR5781304.1 caspase family protein [Caballeronia sp. LZ065]